MLTVVGLLVYSLIQRQVRQYLHLQHQCLPGNKGDTATPTADVVLAPFTQVTLVHLQRDDTEVWQVHGWQEHHQIVCDALGVDASWYDVLGAQKNKAQYGFQGADNASCC